MDNNKSLDEVNLIAALLLDVHTSHGVVFNTRALKNTVQKVLKRTRSEGLSFLTKTLPRLGKAFQKALSGHTPLNCIELGFEPADYIRTTFGPEYDQTEFFIQSCTGHPKFLGEFFSRVLHRDGTVLPDPCADSVRILQQVLFLFYKYELDYTDKQEQKVLDSFTKTEEELHEHATKLQDLFLALPGIMTSRRQPDKSGKSSLEVVREARILLNKVFQSFDPMDISPRHGPGSVSTGERLYDKWTWSNVPDRITDLYPLDKYYYLSPGHVCDELKELSALSSNESSAKVILVPKDSRGPRLISCEPLEFQWIQQGLSRAIVRHVETHDLSRFNVFFTDQGPNQRGALLGSSTGRYSTLDLNEASDRVSLDLVRLLFPEPLLRHLLACRSLSTTLPCGKKVRLDKYAPMGSALCFPVLALSVWALLTAAASDADTRDGILVYGDDVIVPTGFTLNAMNTLESFGLKINRDKSCTSGFFRESCGVDAFLGRNVTPLRIRTVWSESPCPNAYSSWIAYANHFRDRHYYRVYDFIVDRLHAVYGEIPDDSMELSVPSLRVVDESYKPKKSRINHNLQKREWKVWDLKAPVVVKELSGWKMLLRYFCEARQIPYDKFDRAAGEHHDTGRLPYLYWYSDDRRIIDVLKDSVFAKTSLNEEHCFSVRQYTKRRASMLVQRWR